MNEDYFFFPGGVSSQSQIADPGAINTCLCAIFIETAAASKVSIPKYASRLEIFDKQLIESNSWLKVKQAQLMTILLKGNNAYQWD